MKTLSFATGAVLAACSDNGFHSLMDDAQPRDAGIEVTPASIDFGAVDDAQVVAIDQIVIANVGESDLYVEDVAIDGKDAPQFRLLDDDTSFLLPAGASKTLHVEFAPGGALDAVARVVVTSTDPVQPVLPVDLRGSEAVPQIAIEPDPADFGVVDVGCQASRPISVVSVGDEPVTVDAIASVGDAYTLSYGFPLPQMLDPGETLVVDLVFAPGEDRDFAGTIEVDSDAYGGKAVGRQLGSGAFADSHRDSWTLEDLEADILFFVDHSGSMDDNAAALATNFSGFIEHLNDYASDWQVLVAGNEDGCSLTGILSSSVPGYVTSFTDAVTITEGNPYDEAGLTVASLAVEATDPGECNAGFLRPDALLHVIMLSDEAEQSLHGWDAYVDAIVAKKGDASLVRMSAIAGTAADALGKGSDLDECFASEGFGYQEAVAATGGVYLSICSDWAASMGALADATVTQTTFALSQVDPVPASVTVTVDGQAATGWSFDAATSSVVFDAASAPAQGQTVDVDYATYGACN